MLKHSSAIARLPRLRAGLAAWLLLPLGCPAATFTVTSPSDFTDADPGDGACNPFPLPDVGPCTLRAALEESAALAGADEIRFDLPAGQRVIEVSGSHHGQVNQALRASGPLLIDGSSQPGYAGSPLVQLDFFSTLIAGLVIEGEQVTVRALSITDFPLEGIQVIGAEARIEHCWIGIHPDGTTLGQNLRGVQSTAAATVVANNVISGNATGGVVLSIDAAQAEVRDNLIGLLPDGLTAVGNGPAGEGVYDFGTENTIGPGNTVAGHANPGVRLRGSGTSVYGNRIGTDAAGALARPNGAAGVMVDGATVIGIGVDNQIAGNAGFGILVAGASEVRIRGNRIGSDASGLLPIPNLDDGIRIQRRLSDGSRYVTIGEVTPLGAFGNLIVASGGDGIDCREGAEFIDVWDNRIGVAADGVGSLGNGADGVRLDNCNLVRVSAPPLLAPDYTNHIAHNAGNGITAVGSGANQNLFLENRIHDNGGIGIDLGDDDVTANDPGDGDDGPNQLLNFPVVHAEQGGILVGALDARPTTAYFVDLFDNDACDPGGHGEAQRFVDGVAVVTDATGHAEWELRPWRSGANWVAMATDVPAQESSELGPCFVPGVGLLGDRVFADLDGDGLQDEGEAGVAGVRVELERDDGSPVADTRSGTDGRYRFEALASGDYRLRFVLPPNYQFTSADQGGDDAADSDVVDSDGRTATFGYSADAVDLGRDAGVRHDLFLDGFERR